MTEQFDRQTYFDRVRKSLFSGALTQQQVDGQNVILADWEGSYGDEDLRWLAYALATTMHETASTMWPIEEYGKGAGQPYGKPDANGNTFYGRGFVQLTWADNYKRATQELGLTGEEDLYRHPEKALDPFIAGLVMFRGMIEGWFRSDSKGKQTLARYFDDDTDDAFNAREIINGDRNTIPTWSNGISIGRLIETYHGHFLDALVAAADEYEPEPEPAPPQPVPELVTVGIMVSPGTKVAFYVNGEQIVQATAANGEETA